MIAAFLGTLLRFAFVIEMPVWFKYMNVLHAHSHGAMMGWLTAAFFALIFWMFNINDPRLIRLFWISQLSVVGMIISFPIQGYGPVSIAFSSIFMIVAYIISYRIWKNVKARDEFNPTTISFLLTSLFFLAFSTIGVWSFIPIQIWSYKGSALYYSMVQFFLHFQFNGWFIFCILALFFRWMDINKIVYDPRRAKVFFWLLVVSCLMTYALSVTWSTPLSYIFWINTAGVILQLMAAFYLLDILRSVNDEVKKRLSKWQYYLLWISIVCLLLKICIQTFVALPYLATISYTIKNFVIGFIHLLMLGCLSTFIFSMAAYSKYKVSKVGVWLFLLGFLSTEALLFGQGLMLWGAMGFLPNYHLTLALASALLFIGVFIVFINFTAIHKKEA